MVFVDEKYCAKKLKKITFQTVFFVVNSRQEQRRALKKRKGETKMKKFFSLLLVLIVSISAISFTAFSGGNETAKQTITYQFEDSNGEDKKVLIHLELDGGEIDDSNIVLASYGDELSLPVPVRKGYEFIGYYFGNDYQITTKNGNVNGRAIVNEAFGVSKDKEASITLTAKYEVIKNTVNFIFPDGIIETVEFEPNSYFAPIEVVGRKIKKVSINPSGKPIYSGRITSNLELYVVEYEISGFSKTYSSEDNSGYDLARGGTRENNLLISGWELGDGNVSISKAGENTKLKVKYTLKQDVSNLPLGNTHDIKPALNKAWLSNDTYSGRIVGTRVNEKVGYGTLVATLYYEDGETREYSKTNVFNSSYQGETFTLCETTYKEGNKIERVEINVCYEIAFNNKLSYWVPWGLCTWTMNARQIINFEI